MLGSPASGDVAVVAHDVEVADLAAAGVFLPAAGPGPEPVAGDFYDVLPLLSGAVAILLGDVSGHGPGAVERMRSLRAAAAGCVAVDAAPSLVLARLDTIMQALGPEDLATLWCGLYRPGSGELTYSSAGHPPPMLLEQGVPARPLALSDAPPLGTGFVRQVAEHMTVLAPGSVLVAYSDGLIERQRTHFDDQLALLGAAADAACGPHRDCMPASVAVGLVESLVPEPDAASDDVCVLVLRRLP